MKADRTENKIERTENKIERIEKESVEKETKHLIKGFLGRDIIAVLRGKVKIKGRLESMSQYELIITVSERPVLIMKHAVDYIELTETT